MHMVDFNKDTEGPNLRFSRVMTRLWLSTSVEARFTKGTRNVALGAPLVDLAVKLGTARQEIFRGVAPSLKVMYWRSSNRYGFQPGAPSPLGFPVVAKRAQ